MGYPTIHVLENDTGPDDCNHAQFGSFILAASRPSAAWRVDRGSSARYRTHADGAGRLRDPASMQGRSLVADKSIASPRSSRTTTKMTRRSFATASADWDTSAELTAGVEAHGGLEPLVL